MTKRTFLLIAAIMLSCAFNMKATSASKHVNPATNLKASTRVWNFVYYGGNGPISGLTWSNDYLYVTSGDYVVYSAHGYAFLTPWTPVYCSASVNANTYVQVGPTGGGSGTVSFYDFQNW